MKHFFRANWIVLVIGLSFLTSTLLAIRNNHVIEKNHVLQQQADLVKQRTQEILSKTMHGLDLGVRGYGLAVDDQFLIPYNEAIETTPITFRQLDSLLKVQNYHDRGMLPGVQARVNDYIEFSKGMISKARQGSHDEFLAMLKEDRGYEVWKNYAAFADPLFAFEDELNRNALIEYQKAMRSNLILQVVILILALPMLYIFVSKVKNERTAREKVLAEVESTDKTFVFDNGAGSEESGSGDINARAIANIKQASSFIGKIALGDYQVEWPGLTNSNLGRNAHTLAGNLVSLRDRLKTLKDDDDRRNWLNEGLATFSDIVRKNQNDNDGLSIACISYLTKYIGAQQGSLFMLEENNGEPYLKLAACYAFDRKKWIEKTIDIGTGLVGQAYLEGEPIKLKEVPKEYIHITSGLGEANPTFIAIVPMKYEGNTLLVAEFASFSEVPDNKILFLQKSGEFLAAALFSVRTNARMRKLLDEASLREQQMKEREEELRQNMEELQAIEEDRQRKRERRESVTLTSAK